MTAARLKLKAALTDWRVRRLPWRKARLRSAQRRHDRTKVRHYEALVASAIKEMARLRSAYMNPPKPFEPLFGIDWAWGNPSIAELQKAGVKFACRYLSHDKSKNLDAAEAKALSAAGINVVVVWETSAGRALAGRAAGEKDAHDAKAQALACGMPAGRPIYFAVDFDMKLTQRAQVADYFRGVASVLGTGRVGAYGGVLVIDSLLADKLITWAWQTYAWSGGAWNEHAHIQQYANGKTLAGVSCDYDRAMRRDYGQWRTP
jgi:hypothetical protein